MSTDVLNKVSVAAQRSRLSTFFEVSEEAMRAHPVW